MTREEIVAWLRDAEIGDVAYIEGAAFQLMAMAQGVTEADLYAEFARRAADDPDANVVRRKFLDGHIEIPDHRYEGQRVSETPNLDLFIETKGDHARLALGLGVLQSALDEAREALLQGWAEEVYLYLYALESGKGLNNPFDASNTDSRTE